jgi:hypothetical protein
MHFGKKIEMLMIKMLKKIKSPAIKKHQGSSLLSFLYVRKFIFALSSSTQE